jgi:molecular chaperone HscB
MKLWPSSAECSKPGPLLDVAKDPAQAVGQVRALMFIERFTQEVNAKLDRLT